MTGLQHTQSAPVCCHLLEAVMPMTNALLYCYSTVGCHRSTSLPLCRPQRPLCSDKRTVQNPCIFVCIARRLSL